MLIIASGILPTKLTGAVPLPSQNVTRAWDISPSIIGENLVNWDLDKREVCDGF
jgi:hypothetical protein